MKSMRDKAYERGVRDTRLNGHDFVLRRLEFVQMVSAVMAFGGLTWLSLVTQRLGDKANASAATAIALAQALKEEKDTARDTLASDNTSSQTKWSRSNTVIAAIGLLLSFTIGLGTFVIATR